MDATRIAAHQNQSGKLCPAGGSPGMNGRLMSAYLHTSFSTLGSLSRCTRKRR